MDRSRTHELLARNELDDRARAAFVVGLKRQLRALGRGNEALFEGRAAPAFRRQHGAVPANVEQVHRAMRTEGYYRLWSALTRHAQEMMWHAVEVSVTRDTPRMQAAAHRLTRAHAPRGSLRLTAGFVPPEDITRVEIHCQPGGYMRDAGDDDLTAGALYESGGNLYASGVGIGAHDSKSAAVIRFLAGRFPGLRPRRVLDLGCSAGGASVGYAATFTDAEVHAVDAAPAMLRYAHARAEALQVAVHFRQMDVRALDYPDGSFDLVVSHNLMHEISSATMTRLFAETHRVLRPGGIAVHQDVPTRGARTLFERFMFDWETRYNNEPFWQVFAAADIRGALEHAGFARADIFETELPKLDGPGAWYLAVACKPASATASRAP